MATSSPNTLPEAKALGSLILPQAFLVEFMPTLRDSEFRVLLLVLAYTLGWKETDGSRRRRAWISHHWMQVRTGRSGQSVSDAIDTLVKQGVLSVTADNGFPLDSKENRRAYRGRPLIGLSQHLWLRTLEENPWLSTPPRDRKDSSLKKLESIKQREILTTDKTEAHFEDGGEAAALKRPFTTLRVNEGWQRAGSLAVKRKEKP